MHENYGPYLKGEVLRVISEGPDWVRTNRGIYVPKLLLEIPEQD